MSMAFALSWIHSLYKWIVSRFWKKKLELSVVGLQNAGKTTLMNALSGDADMETIPTVGFNLRHLKKGNVSLQVWDLGGQQHFRHSWEKYCRDSDVIVFVVDSSDLANIDLARTELERLLAWPSLEGIPVLVLGNKNDLPNALSVDQLSNSLKLATITNRKLAVYSISAKLAQHLDVVLQWLSALPSRKG